MKNFLTKIWGLFYETVIDSWENSKTLSIIASILWILIILVIFMFGYVAYSIIDHEINGISHGIVKSKRFEQAHYETQLTTISDGKSVTTLTIPEFVPDRWYIEVVGDNGRKETWRTYNESSAKNIIIDQVITSDDNWNWVDTN